MCHDRYGPLGYSPTGLRSAGLATPSAHKRWGFETEGGQGRDKRSNVAREGKKKKKKLRQKNLRDNMHPSMLALVSLPHFLFYSGWDFYFQLNGDKYGGKQTNQRFPLARQLIQAAHGQDSGK